MTVLEYFEKIIAEIIKEKQDTRKYLCEKYKELLKDYVNNNRGN